MLKRRTKKNKRALRMTNMKTTKKKKGEWRKEKRKLKRKIKKMMLRSPVIKDKDQKEGSDEVEGDWSKNKPSC